MRNSTPTASDYDGRRVVMAASTVKTSRNHWAGGALLVGAGAGSNPTRNQIFLIKNFNAFHLL